MPPAATRSFRGATATAGNSRAIRFEKAFYAAAPEFYAAGNAVRADIIGPGTVLVSVNTSQMADAPDPVIGAWLSFIDRDIQSNPGDLVAMTAGELAGLEALVEGVIVDDDFALPDDLIF